MDQTDHGFFFKLWRKSGCHGGLQFRAVYNFASVES